MPLCCRLFCAPPPHTFLPASFPSMLHICKYALFRLEQPEQTLRARLWQEVEDTSPASPWSACKSLHSPVTHRWEMLLLNVNWLIGWTRKQKQGLREGCVARGSSGCELPCEVSASVHLHGDTLTETVDRSDQDTALLRNTQAPSPLQTSFRSNLYHSHH